jgi:hypothetical protein
MTFNRPLNWQKPTIKQVMSSRSPMWELSARGIKKRPLFGWGFDGFGIAYPYIRNPQVTPRKVERGRTRTIHRPYPKSVSWYFTYLKKCCIIVTLR